MAQYSIGLLQFSGSPNYVRTHAKHLHSYVRHITETHISCPYAMICHRVLYTYVTMHAEHLAHPDVFLTTGTK